MKHKKLFLGFIGACLVAAFFGIGLNHYSSRVKDLWIPGGPVAPGLKSEKLYADIFLVLFLAASAATCFLLLRLVREYRRK